MRPVYAVLLPFAGDPLDETPWHLALRWVGLDTDAAEDIDHSIDGEETGASRRSRLKGGVFAASIGGSHRATTYRLDGGRTSG